MMTSGVEILATLALGVKSSTLSSTELEKSGQERKKKTKTEHKSTKKSKPSQG